MTTKTQLVQLKLVNGEPKPVTTSVIVAAQFKKPHHEVITSIANIKATCSREFAENNYELVTYENNDTAYLITKDGFSLLTIGYQYDRVMAKEELIYHFNCVADAITPSRVRNNIMDALVATRTVLEESDPELKLALDQIYERELGYSILEVAGFDRQRTNTQSDIENKPTGAKQYDYWYN